jgi:catalase (peroxidase I)
MALKTLEAAIIAKKIPAKLKKNKKVVKAKKLAAAYQKLNSSYHARREKLDEAYIKALKKLVASQMGRSATSKSAILTTQQNLHEYFNTDFKENAYDYAVDELNIYPEIIETELSHAEEELDQLIKSAK